MKELKMEELKEVLKSHEKWLNGEQDGIRADLSNVDLSYANLRGADLSCANLRGADLKKLI